uniref:signal-regulatory protein beta-2-like n=1 Tax=Scatophagus argus TaxID=75038 RepID=UPI001ED86365|nr:signal-regulatory protein beta-2-like [Scatophagus argus]
MWKEQKMSYILFYILLMLRVGRCAAQQNFVRKTVAVGQSVTLTCARQTSERVGTLFWIKLVAGKLPEILGKVFSFDYDDGVKEISRIFSKQEPNRFDLHITKAMLSDTAFYYCLKVKRLNITFVKGAFLNIKGSEPDITAVIQEPPSDSVHPGDSVTLQCSVLSDPEDKTCPGGPSLFWFKAGSDESHPSVIYTHGDSGDGCDKSPEAHAPQKCVYSFSKNISSSDAGTYYCAVATCGEILFGNGTKLDIEDVSVDSIRDFQKDDVIFYLVCAALAISLIVIAFLVYTIRNKPCGCCNDVVTLQTNATTGNDDKPSQQRNDDTLVYSTPNFTKRKAGKAGRRRAPAMEETVYTDVRAFVIN